MSQSTIPWKKILIAMGVLCGIGLVFLLVAGMVLKHAAEDFLVKFETDLPALAEEGVQFAASHDQAAVWWLGHDLSDGGRSLRTVVSGCGRSGSSGM